MNTYTTYQPTNITWLGEIPSHWELTPIKALFNERNERNTGIKTDFILSVTKDRGVIPYDEKGLIGNNKSEDIEKYKLVYPNDLVINKMNVVIGSLGISKYFGAFSHVYLVYYPRNNNIYMKYFSHLFSIPSFYRSLIKYCTGIMELRESLNKDNFKNINLPLPPLPEQTTIADYLDAKTAQIQTAIRLKSEQIATLKEYRQALINECVTKGLNPNAALKNSGVVWLGEVPEHWEVLALKRVARINPSVYVSNKRSDEKVCFLPMEKVLANGKIISDIFLPIKDISSGFTVFSKNDVIVAKITPCFENGKSAFLDSLPTELGYGSTEFHVLRPSDKILGKFLYLIVHSQIFLNSGEAMMIGSAGQKRVPMDFVANYKIALPPITEQTAIADYLDNKTAQIDTALATYQAQIDKLNEYQRSLVNDVVTGKIDVRTI